MVKFMLEATKMANQMEKESKPGRLGRHIEAPGYKVSYKEKESTLTQQVKYMRKMINEA